MKRYPAYKESSVEWIGEVPEHWEIARSDSRLFPTGSAVSKEWLTGKEVFHYSIPVVQEIQDGQVEEGDLIDSGKTLLRETALLVSKLNPRKGTIVLASPHDIPTVCSGEFVAMAPKACVAKYAEYSFRSEGVRQYLDSTVESVTRSHQRAKPNFIRKLRWCWPPVQEQWAIAAFLDRETARIDILVDKKKRQIELLQEQRAAIINQAVTKGLDPSVPMKESGIPWLGEVPEHWDIAKLNYLSKITRLAGAEYTTYWETSEDGEIEVLRGQNVGFGQLLVDGLDRITHELSEKLIRSKLFRGDIVFPCVGSIGNAAVVQESNKFHINQNMAKISPKNKVADSYFLMFFLLSAPTKFQIHYYNTSDMQPSVLVGNLRRFLITVPPKREQDAIALHLKIKNKKIDDTIKSTNKEILLLQEYRTTLISEVVTGKIDVREEVVNNDTTRATH